MTEFKSHLKINPKTIRKRIDEIIASELKNHSRPEALRKILSVIDLTSLTGKETPADITALCQLAKSFEDRSRGIPAVAAVCVYPGFVRQAKDELGDTEILVATVAGGFPDGDTPTKLKLEEVQEAIAQGADEIDMVLNYKKLLAGDFTAVHDDIAQVKSVCRELDLKVILETGKLETLTNVRKAAEIAIEAGADFIKSSTGKVEPAATEEALLVMLHVIKEYYLATGIFVGIKPAGGIREPLQAFHYLCLVYNVLGGQWLTPAYFRIGASQLATKVYQELTD